jgi:hypothetical protein
MTANAANATFFFDTFTIPYINTQDITVSSVMNFTGSLATFSNLYVPGNANMEYLSVSNLTVTGNLYVTATNVETTNALTINNSGTMTALKVTQNETSIHTHNVAEFWDASVLAMVIDPEGNVGIHTTVSPNYALTVTDPANFETLYIRGKTGVTNTLDVTGNVSATRYYGDGGALSNLISFVGATGPTGATGPSGSAPAGSAGQVVYLSSSGVAAAATNFYWDSTNSSVGVGTASPGYTLTVTGTIGATADITAFTSDERLKTKTGVLIGALDKVCTLDTFTYTHNDLARSFGFTDNRQYVGISAQQVRKVQPEVVRMAPFDADGEKSKSGEDYMTVQYERLVPLLIEALKEERKAREALEERVKLLEQK